jgi:DNA-binding XRE family transcriptional regulator
MEAYAVCRVIEYVGSEPRHWSALARQTGLPPQVIRRLRDPRANPSLAVAEQVARALDLPIEALWELAR